MYIIWVILILMLVCGLRIVIGPSVWDRLLGLNLVSTKIIIVLVLYASFKNTAYILDIAIACALLGFIGVIFTAMFVQKKESQ